jgi:hypothetical protein
MNHLQAGPQFSRQPHLPSPPLNHLTHACQILNSVVSRGLVNPETLRKENLPHLPGADRSRFHPLRGIEFVVAEIGEVREGEHPEARCASLGGLVDRLLHGSIEGRCPITILSERVHQGLADELDETSQREVETRLATGVLAVLKFDCCYLELLKSPDFYRLAFTTPPCPAFRQVPTANIAALLIPSALQESLVETNLLSAETRAKLQGVEGHSKLSRLISGLGPEAKKLHVPDWRPSLMSVIVPLHLQEEERPHCFGLHAIRLPTAKDMTSPVVYS